MTLPLAWWRAVCCGVMAAGLLQPARAADGISATAVATAASAAPTHRPLRQNRPALGLPAPTEPEVFTGIAGAPAYSVLARKPALALYPCSQCHKVLPLNTQPRKLVAAPHPAALTHGQGRMWCLDCHQGTDRDVLHTIHGSKVDFNESQNLCGQCHSARHRDWAFGAHGKRVAGWGGGDRQLYACTHCHDPHNPVLQPRAPSAPPPVRAGLDPMNRTLEPALLPWQRTLPGAHDGQAAKH
jgi:hypothetical protein